MDDVATVTQLSPARRVDTIMEFLRRLKTNSEVLWLTYFFLF